MEEDKVHGPQDEMALQWRERDRNFTTTNELAEFCTLDVLVEDCSLHVMFPDEISMRLTWRQFPAEPFHIPTLSFDEEGLAERYRDFLFANASADGFLLSAKAKQVMEKFDLGVHRFYPATIVYRKPGLFARKEKFDFFWLHLIFDERQRNYVDFKRSVFTDKVTLKGDVLSNDELSFPSLEAWDNYRVQRHEEWRSAPGVAPHHEIRPAQLKLLPDTGIPDLFGLGKINPGLRYSKKALAQALLDSGVKGLRIRGSKMLSLE